MPTHLVSFNLNGMFAELVLISSLRPTIMICGKLMLKRLRNAGLIAASIAISFLGAFTSTQLFVSPIDFAGALVLHS